MKIQLINGKYRLAAPDPVVEAMMDRSHRRTGPLEWEPFDLPPNVQAQVAMINNSAPIIEFDEKTGEMFLQRAFPSLEAQLDAEHERVAPLRWRPKKKQGMRGLGDAVKWLTDKVGIPQCGGCKSRQEWLNKVWPF